MNMKRMLIVAGVLLILFLAMYSWNRRTRMLDDMATNAGLEIASAILSPLQSIKSTVVNFWERYFNLVDVREENLRLKKRLEEMEAQLLATGEDLAELKRLRELVQFPVDVRWKPLAARVLAGRLGPNAVLDSITISRGYANGARPGLPLVTNKGLVGRILKSSAHASTALLITDPGSRVAVFGQESRAPGVLKGHGTGKDLEVDYVQRNASLKMGEVLVTSGLDDKYPKGLPVARVTGVSPSDYTQFMAINAVPLVDLQHLEEVLILEKSGVETAEPEIGKSAGEFVGPPVPPKLARKKKIPAQAPAAASMQTPQTPDAATPRPDQPQNVQPQTEAQPVHASPRAPRKTPPSPAVPQPAGPEGASPRPQAQPLPSGEDIPRTREGAPRYRIITP